MTQPLLIIVTGPPAAGKTTLGRRLAGALALPFIHKDGLKETLFDVLGWRDRAWSRQLGAASSELLYYIAEALLTARKSLMIESNFDPKFAVSKLLELKARLNLETVQIQCTASRDILLERFKKRSEGGERHPGHLDHLYFAEFSAEEYTQRDYALAIGGLQIQVDTTDFQQEGVNSILEQIQKYQRTSGAQQ